MRLLNAKTLELEFFPAEKPLYAILSHTWGPEEVLYEDARHGASQLQACGKKGLEKVLKSAETALRNGYSHIWIDTCCIDKSSSAELSEAINSMFYWYAGSGICFAYLQDFHDNANIYLPVNEAVFSKSRWFTRGWTLQELIAPTEVWFFNSSWKRIGSRLGFAAMISRITGVDERVLERATPATPNLQSCLKHYRQSTSDGDENKRCDPCYEAMMLLMKRLLKSISTSTKMSWVSARETTRTEDIAYCTMGIFDVHMPLLYGEGIKAFQRLQQEIAKQSHDQTILAWDEMSSRDSIFAPHPSMFRFGSSYHHIILPGRDMVMTTSNAGLELDVYLAPCTVWTHRKFGPQIGLDSETWLAVLNCCSSSDYFSSPALILNKTDRASFSFCRKSFSAPFTLTRPLMVRKGQSCCVIRPVYSYPPSGLGDLVNPTKGESENDLSKDGMGVEFNPSTLTKTRVLLHEPQSVPATIENPRCRFLLTGDLSKHFHIIRQAPSLDAPAAMREGPIELKLPIRWLSKDPWKINLAYGAALVSNKNATLADKNGPQVPFIVVWGVSYPFGMDFEMAYKTVDGWRSPGTSPFCAVWAISKEQKEYLSNFKPFPAHNSTLGSEEKQWIEKLQRRYVQFISDNSAHCKYFAKTVQTPEGIKSLSGVLLKFQGSNHCEGKVEAEMETVEFLGRSMYHVNITIRAVSYDERTQGEY